MVDWTLSKQFERKVQKVAKKDNDIVKVLGDALEKLGQDPLPNSLHFKPVTNADNRYYMRIPQKRGWRIYLRKVVVEGHNAVYEVIDFGNHDSKREGN